MRGLNQNLIFIVCICWLILCLYCFIPGGSRPAPTHSIPPPAPLNRTGAIHGAAHLHHAYGVFGVSFHGQSRRFLPPTRTTQSHGRHSWRRTSAPRVWGGWRFIPRAISTIPAPHTHHAIARAPFMAPHICTTRVGWMWIKALPQSAKLFRPHARGVEIRRFV